MKATVVILLLTLIFAFTAFGQHASDSLSFDAGAVRRVTLIDPGLALGKPTLLLPPSLLLDSKVMDSFSADFREDSALSPLLLGGSAEKRLDLLIPYRLQMESEARLRPLQTLLGTVQIGGAAYLAYRYLKKHGLK